MDIDLVDCTFSRRFVAGTAPAEAAIGVIEAPGQGLALAVHDLNLGVALRQVVTGLLSLLVLVACLV